MELNLWPYYSAVWLERATLRSNPTVTTSFWCVTSAVTRGLEHTLSYWFTCLQKT